MDNQNQQNQQQVPPSQQGPQSAQAPQKQQAAARIQQANNILVTVSNNPTVDQLAACIGLTLALNHLGKHATAVFSGAVPSTIEFLQPEKTIEKNTDSLRDFIIALDKAKADKLRYKVEDSVVKIFITPYRTSISDKDLQFSQGDFNVDVVVALGVHNQRELDQAITAHGRILHDASVITMNIQPGGELGAINWLDQRASSLSELVVQLVDVIDKRMLDPQMATALLTGIVAETQRFSNKKTSALTMSYSAELMAAGANQQLIATKLEPPKPPPPPPPPPVSVSQPQKPAPFPAQPQPPEPKPDTEGMLQILHDEDQGQAGGDEAEPLGPQIDIDQEGTLRRIEEQKAQAEQAAAQSQPLPQPQASDQAGARPEPQTPSTPPSDDQKDNSASTDPNSHMSRQHHILKPLAGQGQQASAPPAGTLDTSRTPILHRSSEPGRNSDTLEAIEKSVDSPHVSQNNSPSQTGGGSQDDDQNGPVPSGMLPPPVPPPITPQT